MVRHWKRIASQYTDKNEAESKVNELKAQGREVKLSYIWVHHGKRCTPRKSRGFSILELKYE